MKKILCKRLLPLLLTAIMLFSAALPIFGASGGVSAPSEDDPYYTVVLEDGILTLRLNPDKVYEVLRDGDVTREELKNFIPEDVLDAITDGDGLSLEELASVAANYITADDLAAVYDMVPAEVFFEYFDLSLLMDIVTLNELLDIIPVDEMLADISDEDIMLLINDDAFGLLLTDTVKETILTDDFIEKLLGDGNIVEEIANDKELHDALADLVDDGVINKMLEDAKIKEAIIKLAEDKNTLKAILNDKGEDPLDPSDDAVTLLKNYMQSHTEKIENFVNDKDVIGPLKESEIMQNFLATHIEVHTVIDISEVDIDKFMSDYNITADNLKDNATALGITADEIIKYTSFAALIEDNVIDLDKLKTVYGITDESLKENAADLGITVEEIMEYADLDGILASDIINIDEFCRIYGITEQSIKENAEALGITEEDIGQITTLADFIKKIAENGKTDELRELYSITNESLKENATALGITAGNIVNYVDFAVMINNGVIDTDALCAEYGINVDTLSANADTLGIDVTEVMKYVDFKDLIEHDVFDLVAFHDIYSVSMSSLIEKGYLSDADIAHLFLEEWEQILKEEGMLEHIIEKVGLHAIFEDFGRDDLVGVLGGYHGLIERGYFSEEDVIKAIGSIDVGDEAEDSQKLIAGYKKLINILLSVDGKLEAIIDIVGYDTWKKYIKLDDIINAAGIAAGKAEGEGTYADLARLYSMEQLIDVIDAIGISNIVDFAKTHDIHKKIDIKEMISDVLDLALSKKDKLKPFARKLASCVSSFVTNEISVMELNGKPVYKNGSFDLQAIVTAVAQAIPDVDKFLEMESGDVFCQLILSAEVRGEPFKLGAAVEFIGDLTRLKELAQTRAHYFRIDVTDELDVTAEMVVPAVVSELYMRGLNSARVPARLKTKILEFPTMTVAEMSDLLRGLTKEEISDYSAEIMEEVDEIKEKVYGKLEESLGSDNDLLERAKNKVDEILQTVSDPEKLSALRDKSVSALDMLSDKTDDLTVADIYDGNGVFSFDRGFSVDVWTLANKVRALPEDILVLFDNDMTLTGSLDMTVTVNGLYKATVTGSDGVTNEFFLPAGIAMSVLNDYTSVAYDFSNMEMPAHDAFYAFGDVEFTATY